MRDVHIGLSKICSASQKKKKKLAMLVLSYQIVNLAIHKLFFMTQFSGSVVLLRALV